ncbi:MAG: adenylate cyclase, partial [Solirubrobacteraceae bacterium]|nr:adenylate cyclase [Solirubrobacteraceae bacterium]
MDFDEAGLLEGLEGDERAARVRLLESLASDGYTLDELSQAALEDRLALLPVEHVLAGEYTARDLERMTGLSASTLLRIRRSLGLPEAQPDERTFSEADIEA